MRRHRQRISLGSSVVIATLAAAAALGCSPKPSSGDVRTQGPLVSDFTANCIKLDGGPVQACGVSAMLERRCGSLDCHGYVRRPMRLYSKYGLRLPPADPTIAEVDAGPSTSGNEPGLGETTPEERAQNYLAVTGVEPEQTQEVAKGNAQPNTLLIYKKPLGIEHHKGGSPVNKGDDSETCLVSWLQGTIDRLACGKAAELP
jgi:hypothetical protein